MLRTQRRMKQVRRPARREPDGVQGLRLLPHPLCAGCCSGFARGVGVRRGSVFWGWLRLGFGGGYLAWWCGGDGGDLDVFAGDLGQG